MIVAKHMKLQIWWSTIFTQQLSHNWNDKRDKEVRNGSIKS